MHIDIALSLHSHLRTIQSNPDILPDFVLHPCAHHTGHELRADF